LAIFRKEVLREVWRVNPTDVYSIEFIERRWVPIGNDPLQTHPDNNPLLIWAALSDNYEGAVMRMIKVRD
jgi:hypothetical protein